MPAVERGSEPIPLTGNESFGAVGVGVGDFVARASHRVPCCAQRSTRNGSTLAACRLAKRCDDLDSINLQSIVSPHVVYGGMIVLFLIVEPMGLGKLYGNVRNYLMLWPFGYARK